MKTLTKYELQKTIAKQLGIPNTDAANIVGLFFEEIMVTLESGKSVNLSGFGNFKLRCKVARPGRNPKTGEPKEICARTVITFHPTKKLLIRLNNAEQ